MDHFLIETNNGFFLLNSAENTLPVLRVTDPKQFTPKTKYKAPFIADPTKVSDLKEGDFLLMPRNHPWGEKAEVSEAFAQALGYLYSSGVSKCQSRQEPFSEIMFRFPDSESLKDLCQKIGQNLTEKTKYAWFPIKKVNLSAGFSDLEIQEIQAGMADSPYPSTSPLELLQTLGCKDSLPDFILNAPKSIVCSFLRTLIEKDAMIHPERGGLSVKLYFRNESPMVLHQVRLLLFKLGIITTLLEKPSIGFSLKNMGYLKIMWSELGLRRELTVGEGEVFFNTPIFQYKLTTMNKWGASLKSIASEYHSEKVTKITPFREVGEAESFYENLSRTYPIVEEMYVPTPPKPQPKRSLHDWQAEWFDMPEFVQEKSEPYAKILFQFPDEESILQFSELIGQSLTTRTKSAWFPELVRGMNRYKRWASCEP